MRSTSSPTKALRNLLVKPITIIHFFRFFISPFWFNLTKNCLIGGSLYLFNKRVLKFFRKDGHRWRRRRDQRTIAEAHERLKVVYNILILVFLSVLIFFKVIVLDA